MEFARGSAEIIGNSLKFCRIITKCDYDLIIKYLQKMNRILILLTTSYILSLVRNKKGEAEGCRFKS